MHSYLEDKCTYDALKFEINYDGIAKALSCELNGYNIIDLNTFNLRTIKNTFIKQCFDLFREIIENPAIMSCFNEIISKLQNVEMSQKKTDSDMIFASVKKDLDVFKELLGPILIKIDNPFYHLLQKIGENKDGFSLFIKYMINEINIHLNTVLKDGFDNLHGNQEVDAEEIEIIKSSLIYNYINGSYDYNELFKIKNINIDYLFDLLKDAVSMLNKRIDLIIARREKTRAEIEAKIAEEEAKLSPSERAARKALREQEEAAVAAAQAAEQAAIAAAQASMQPLQGEGDSDW
jgi:hypothetical protein